MYLKRNAIFHYQQWGPTRGPVIKSKFGLIAKLNPKVYDDPHQGMHKAPQVKVQPKNVGRHNFYASQRPVVRHGKNHR